VVLAAIDGVAMVAWMVLCFASGFISLLTYLVALGSIATVVLSRRAYGPCVRTAQARQRAAAAGFDLDL
jgi:hypothetical protein